MKRTILIATMNVSLLFAGCAFHDYKSPDGARLTSGSLFMKRATVDLQRTTTATNSTTRARISGSQADSDALGAVTEAAVRAAVKSVAP